MAMKTLRTRLTSNRSRNFPAKHPQFLQPLHTRAMFAIARSTHTGRLTNTRQRESTLLISAMTMPKTHFACTQGRPHMTPVSDAGDYTIDLLRLNRPHLITLRAVLEIEFNLRFPFPR